MAQPATNPKIEELRFRLKTDPKSRLFFPLAEELRKVSQLGEAEDVLRAGLVHHPAYLSGWVSFGRILRERQKNDEAVEALNRALQIDPGNVVAARLLADAYEAVGEKVEAIKKYKLVHALMPGDQELAATIERLDGEINHARAVEAVPVAEPEPEPEPEAEPEPVAEPEPEAEVAPEPVAEPEPEPEAEPIATAQSPFAEPEEPPAPDESPFAESDIDDEDGAAILAAATVEEEHRIEVETGDVEPMAVAHEDSPFEQPSVSFGYGVDAFAVEAPGGMHVDEAPLGSETDSPWADEPMATAETPFPSAEEPSETEAGDFTDTLTMADLYARQGLIADARHIYENILHRDPGNDDVRMKLNALPAAGTVAEPMAEPELSSDDEATPFAPEAESPAEEMPTAEPLAFAPRAEHGASPEHAKIAKLENWLSKVAKREEGRV